MKNNEILEEIRSLFEKEVQKALKTFPAIAGCEFNAIKFDENAINMVNSITNAVVHNTVAIQENIKVLQTLSEVVKASNVTVDAMMKISNNEPHIVSYDQKVPE